MSNYPIKRIVVHASATKPDMDVRAADIDRWHKDRGWNGIGYHHVITRDGLIEQGRPHETIGAHVLGWNTHSIAVCMAGGINDDGVPEENYTPIQYEALRDLLDILTKRMYPGAMICGHRDLSPDKDGDGVIEEHEWLKACPCFDVGKWYK